MTKLHPVSSNHIGARTVDTCVRVPSWLPGDCVLKSALKSRQVILTFFSRFRESGTFQVARPEGGRGIAELCLESGNVLFAVKTLVPLVLSQCLSLCVQGANVEQYDD